MPNSIHMQAWISASDIALIAEFLERSGVKTRIMADLLRTAIEYASNAAEKKGIARRDEANALHYLEQLGYPLETSKKFRRTAVQLLQQESLEERDEFDDGRLIAGMTRQQLEELINKQEASLPPQKEGGTDE